VNNKYSGQNQLINLNIYYSLAIMHQPFNLWNIIAVCCNGEKCLCVLMSLIQTCTTNTFKFILIVSAFPALSNIECMFCCRSRDRENDFSSRGDKDFSSRGDKEEVGGPSRPSDYEGPPGMQPDGLIEVCSSVKI